MISVIPGKTVLAQALVVRGLSCGLQASGNAQWYILIISMWIDFFFPFKLDVLLHFPSWFPWACLCLYFAKLTGDKIGTKDINYVIIQAEMYYLMGREEKWQRLCMKKWNLILGFWLRPWFLLHCQWSLVTANAKVFYCFFAFIQVCALASDTCSHWLFFLTSRLKYGRQDSQPGNMFEKDCKVKWKESNELQWYLSGFRLCIVQNHALPFGALLILFIWIKKTSYFER